MISGYEVTHFLITKKHQPRKLRAKTTNIPVNTYHRIPIPQINMPSDCFRLI